MSQLTITGHVNAKGQYGIYNRGQLDDFCKNNPDKRLIITFQVEDKKSKNGLLAYYNAKIIPEWQKAFFKQGIIKNSIEVDVYLRSLTPITKKKSLSELSYDELIIFIDLLKDVSLADINCFIQDPRCI